MRTLPPGCRVRLVHSVEPRRAAAKIVCHGVQFWIGRSMWPKLKLAPRHALYDTKDALGVTVPEPPAKHFHWDYRASGTTELEMGRQITSACEADFKTVLTMATRMIVTNLTSRIAGPIVLTEGDRGHADDDLLKTSDQAAAILLTTNEGFTLSGTGEDMQRPPFAVMALEPGSEAAQRGLQRGDALVPQDSCVSDLDMLKTRLDLHENVALWKFKSVKDATESPQMKEVHGKALSKSSPSLFCGEAKEERVEWNDVVVARDEELAAANHELAQLRVGDLVEAGGRRGRVRLLEHDYIVVAHRDYDVATHKAMTTYHKRVGRSVRRCVR